MLYSTTSLNASIRIKSKNINSLTRLIRPFIRHRYIVFRCISIRYVDSQTRLDNLVQFTAYGILVRDPEIIDLTFQNDNLVAAEMRSDGTSAK